MHKSSSRTAPSFIDEGTLVNKTDMIRALQTLENVSYTYVVDGHTLSQGKGIVVRIFASNETSTLVINGCLFINVLSFDYLRFSPYKNESSKIELVSQSQILTLVPEVGEMEKPKISRNLIPWSCPYEEDADYLANDFFEED
jgi:hypothetical protein